MSTVGKLKLPDTEFLVLVDLAERAGKTEQEYLADLIREAAWREVTRQREMPAGEVAQCPR